MFFENGLYDEYDERGESLGRTMVSYLPISSFIFPSYRFPLMIFREGNVPGAKRDETNEQQTRQSNARELPSRN